MCEVSEDGCRVAQKSQMVELPHIVISELFGYVLSEIQVCIVLRLRGDVVECKVDEHV